MTPSPPSSAPSSLALSCEFSSLLSLAAPPRRRPRPPRRRRRRFLLSSLSLLSAPSSLAADSATTSSLFLARVARGAFASAAWKTGTGMEAARPFFGVLSSSPLTSGATSDLLFLTARLRGVFGCIAMAPNPLCVQVNALWLFRIRIKLSSKSW